MSLRLRRSASQHGIKRPGSSQILVEKADSQLPVKFEKRKLQTQIERRVHEQIRLSSKYFDKNNSCQSEEQQAYQRKLWALLDPLAYLLDSNS